MTSRQPCIDFLNHSVEETGFVDDAASRNDRLTLAEKLGALSLDWILLKRKLDIKVGKKILTIKSRFKILYVKVIALLFFYYLQVQEIEHKKQDCEQRERRLQQLSSWISEREKNIRVNRRPAGLTQIQQALKDFEVYISAKNIKKKNS